MKISIFGLGYVGCVSAACLARLGHQVIGVDLDGPKLEALKAGRSPIVEPELPELIRTAVAEGRLTVTASAEEAVRATEVSLVCVGTPSRPNGSLDLTYVERVARDIGSGLRGLARPHALVVRSTMLPGSTESLVIPAVEAASGARVDERLTVLYNPEFMREGSSVRDFFKPPVIVFGSRAAAACAVSGALYAGIPAQTFHTSIPCAELLKYANNAFHALKVTFANEIGLLSRRFGIDSHDVMRLVCADTHLNISPAYLTPGFAFGGSCLPKDLRALTYAARSQDLEVPLLRAVLTSNAYQIQDALQRILGFKRRHVGFFGLSFKPKTDDLRESPIVALVEQLVGKGVHVRIYDESISPDRLMGANLRYVEEHLPHFVSLFVQEPEELADKSEVLVFCHKTARARALLTSLPADRQVLDLARVMHPVETPARYEGLSW